MMIAIAIDATTASNHRIFPVRVLATPRQTLAVLRVRFAPTNPHLLMVFRNVWGLEAGDLFSGVSWPFYCDHCWDSFKAFSAYSLEVFPSELDCVCEAHQDAFLTTTCMLLQ